MKHQIRITAKIMIASKPMTAKEKTFSHSFVITPRSLKAITTAMINKIKRNISSAPFRFHYNSPPLCKGMPAAQFAYFLLFTHIIERKREFINTFRGELNGFIFPFRENRGAYFPLTAPLFSIRKYNSARPRGRRIYICRILYTRRCRE